MLFSKQTSYILKIQSFIILALYTICMVGGYKTYKIWYQMEALVGRNPIEHLGGPHGLRYLLISPAVFIADYLSLERNSVFGVMVTIYLSLSVIVISKTQSLISRNIENRWTVWLLLFIPIFVALSFPMNGRLSFMFLGSSLMMLSYIRWSELIVQEQPPHRCLRYAVLCSLSLVMLSVSSGSFTVGMLTAVAQGILFLFMAKRPLDKIIYFVINAIMPLILSYLQFELVHKSIAYYGGSIFAMLSHGPGEFLGELNPNKYLIAIIVAVSTFVVMLHGQRIASLLRTNIYIINPIIMTLIALVIGLFGYSALLTGGLACMLLTIHFSTQWIEHGSLSVKKPWQHFLHQMAFKPQAKLNTKTATIVAVLLFAIIGYTFPDDWRIYKKETVEQSLRSRIVYERDKRVSSLIKGTNFLPGSILPGKNNDLYVVDDGTRILHIAADGSITSFSGDTVSQDGDAVRDKDGPRLQARFRNIVDMKMDKMGNIYIVDAGNEKIKKIDTNGVVTTVAGSGSRGVFYNECPALVCSIVSLRAVEVLPNGELLIATDAQLLRLSNDGYLHSMVYSDGNDRTKVEEVEDIK